MRTTLLPWIAMSLAALAGIAPHRASAAEPPAPEVKSLDTLDGISAWQSLASDGATASVHGAKGLEGGALVLEFDLAKTAGYAAATRQLPTELPEDYEVSFWMRGEAGRVNFEMKFVDASGDNVWWFRRPNFRFSGDWQNIRIKRRQIDFAWGPTDDKELRRFESIEFVVSAGAEGGAGNIWFDRLALKPIVRAANVAKPSVKASSEQPAAARVLDGNALTAWRSARNASAPQSLEIDLQEVREFGGIEIDWVKGLHASNYKIELSTDGAQWQAARSVSAGNGGRDSHLLPESEARWIRLALLGERRPFGIAEIYIRDLEFGASPNAFIDSLAKTARRGCYPRGFRDEQSYWTIVGVDGDTAESLFSEDGALEVRKGGFSVEPFVKMNGTVLTWADVNIEHSLADNYLPIPTVKWRHQQVELSVTAAAAGTRGNAYSEVTYRLGNPTNSTRKFTLALAIRPFQVNPPSQFLNTAGGVTEVRDIAWKDNGVHVDGIPSVYPRSSPSGFRAVTFDAGTPCDWLVAGQPADSVHDDTALASGALLFDIELAAKAQQVITLDMPLHSKAGAAAARPSPDAAATAAAWREKLNRVELDLPKSAQPLFDTLRTAIAHVLINRDGPGLQPGSRSYERSWIRDGAMTSELLLRTGHEAEAKAFLLWYANYQFENGKVPCCVDVRGADPVPENDSGGEFLFLIAEMYRYTNDIEMLRTLWPRVVKAVAYMDKLRLSERTEANRAGERRAFYGLMPASISHEGYSAKPMHSYWDDFWALAGYESATRIARALDEKPYMRQFIESRDQFRADLYRSLQVAMRTHSIDYLPGAAELGDFDATSTSIALSPVGEQQMLPPDALVATFERYWSDFRKRRTDPSWDAYTPYELRNLGTFIRLGWRDRAQELLEFFMADRRPGPWNQWAEVVGREPRKARFIGDMPHGWVASDYGRSVLDMFAFERPADETLVLMAGVPAEWLRKDGFAVRNLRTPYGPLSYSVRIEGDKRIVEVGEIELPPGGISISWPEPPARTGQAIVKGSARWIDTELRIGKVPFRIEFAR
jgi:hypothetical protein